MNQNLKNMLENIIVYTGERLVSGCPIPEYTQLEMKKKGILYSENGTNIYNSQELTPKHSFRVIKNGTIKNILEMKVFKFQSLEEIKKVLNVLCKLENGKWEYINDDIIKITLPDSNFDIEKEYAIPLTPKGISILNNFTTLYKEDIIGANTLPLQTIETKWGYLLIGSEIIGFEYPLTIRLDISHLKKINSINLRKPEELKKLYQDIQPIVSNFFLKDFNIENIYYDINKNKYVIFGITDYLSYDNKIIDIDFSSFINQGSPYKFKESSNYITFEEYLIYKYNFKQPKSWWEYL